MRPSSPEALQLVMEGQAALCDVESHGMRIDTEYLDRVLVETAAKIKSMEAHLREDPVYGLWHKRFGDGADLGKAQQLGTILFDDMGLVPKNFTKSKDKRGRNKPSMSEESLEDVDLPFVALYVSYNKLKKARNTFLMDIKRECHGGYVRPSFNLNLASTYRSSCCDPNLQNQPVRDPRQAKLIRRAFIPRSPDYMLIEIDYSALEFKGAANFWHDPDMIKYASDPELDIHRDMAAECYCLDIDQVAKSSRGNAKNQFVFPIIYGSYYVSCARNLWVNIGRSKLKRVDGVSVYDHLAEKGITDLVDYRPDGSKASGTFEAHIQKVEQRFHERFPHWSTERDKWWQQYTERGWFPLSTGFVCHGVFSYNNLMNTPIQGPSFHILLWSLTRINEYLKKHKMKSKIICQIHDSIIGDVHKSEVDDYKAICKQIMTVDVRKRFPWIVTPLGVECEGSERSWYDKEKLAI